ncbi:hypothetical protein ES703_116285 [subsurface metagenome]
MKVRLSTRSCLFLVGNAFLGCSLDLRHGLVHRPEHGVDKQPAKLRVLEVIRMTQRRVENARLLVSIRPGDRLGFLVRDRANQQPLRRPAQRADLVQRTDARKRHPFTRCTVIPDFILKAVTFTVPGASVVNGRHSDESG